MTEKPEVEAALIDGAIRRMGDNSAEAPPKIWKIFEAFFLDPKAATHKQKQMAYLVYRHKFSVSQAARFLGVSPRSVRSYRSALIAKIAKKCSPSPKG